MELLIEGELLEFIQDIEAGSFEDGDEFIDGFWFFILEMPLHLFVVAEYAVVVG